MTDIFLLPFAGGTSLTYGEWEFSGDIRPVPLDYKGHGFRMKEPLYQTFEEMVNDIADQIADKRENDDIAIFGHSMGGLVAWDVTKSLTDRGMNVKYFFVSACLPPHLFNERLYEEMATDKWLTEFLSEYSRVRQNRLQSKYFKKNIFPAVRNDYHLISIHKHEKVRVIHTNISCFYGRDDKLMPCSGMGSWREYTKGTFRKQAFSGEHFYIENPDIREEVIAAIESLINA